MKVSLNWLKELVDLPPVEALTEWLTKAGVEVEGVEHKGVAIEKVVVARILESTQHPNADRLSVCRVDDGSGQPRQIVCGAKNYKVGDCVPLALPGAVLPGDFKIKTGKLRGVESEGMMCSGKELGVAEDSAGLLILPESAVPGTPIGALFPPDTVLDLEVTPNRPDLLSTLGIAREVATLVKAPLRTPQAVVEAASVATAPATDAEVALEAPEACPYYTARIIRGVKVGPSPAWLRERLEAVGLRPINNVVDITNYVLLELGQPLHAFDLGKLSGGIRVRHATEGEKLRALDGEEYPLAPHHLVIADAQQAQAIAGVMGGEESGVTEATVDLLLESAWFAPAGVRRASRELGLSSDSSYRFERSVDAAGVARASERAVRLILELAGGEAEPALRVAGEAPQSRPVVPLRAERLTAILGTEVPQERVEQILTGFGLEQTAEGWRAPSFRPDLTREIDLIEEIARVIGIEAIPSRIQARFFPASEADRRHNHAARVRSVLAGLGGRETRTLTLISESATALFPIEETPLRVRNPLNEGQVILRPSLLPGLLETAAHNVRNGTRDLRLFEVGRVFRPGTPEERTTLGLLLTGAVAPVSWRENAPRAVDLHDLKGWLAALARALNLEGELTFHPGTHPALGLAAIVRRGEVAIGIAGQLLPARARELDLPGAVLVAEVDLGGLAARPAAGFTELPKFPATTRDVALLLPLGVAHGEVEALLRSANEPLLVGVELFDIFTDPTGEKIPADRKSAAYQLTYRSNERTLTAEEVAETHQRLKERLSQGLNVGFRE